MPTSKIFGERIDAWWYQKHGFDVQFWDISPVFWTQERLDDYYSGTDDYRYVGPNHLVFSSKEDVLEAVNALSKGVIWHLGWNFRGFVHDEHWLLNAIVDTGLPFFIKQFEAALVFGAVARMKLWVRREIACLPFYRRQPAGVIGCGTILKGWARHVFPSATFISIPSPKILWEKPEPLINGEYAVFVDESIGHLPDAKLFDVVDSDDVEGYYLRMNDVFRLLEDELGCPVIIAASGKFYYPENLFRGRRLVYGSTLPLIQHAKLVIGHASGALDQAIVDRKPLLRIDDRSFQEIIRNNMNRFTRFFKNNPISSEQLESIRWAVRGSKCCDEKETSEIEAKYFREPFVNGDYREIIKQAFLSV